MQINSNNYTNIKQQRGFDPQAQQQSFTGLTRYFSSACRSAEELVTAENKYPKNQGVIGSIPFEWVQKIPKELRKERIKELYSSFKEAVDQLHINMASIKTAKNILADAMQKAGIINSADKLNFDLLSKEGRFGIAYSLKVNLFEKETKHYVLKKFRSKKPNRLDVYRPFVHGNYIEQNRAFFKQKDFYNITRKAGRSKNFSRSEWHRGDWPNILFGDVKSAYALFEDAKSLLPPPRRILWVDYGLKASDFNSDNIKNLYYVDYGGIKMENPFIAKNKTARYVYKKVLNDKEPLYKFVWFVKNAKKLQNTQDIYKGIVALLIHVNRNLGFKIHDLGFDQTLKLTQNVNKVLHEKITDDLLKKELQELLDKLQKTRESADRIFELLFGKE